MYDNAYINHLQYRQYPYMSQSEIVAGYNNPSPSSPPMSEAYLQQTFPDMDQGTIKNYSATDNFKFTPIDPNAPTQKELQQEQMSKSLTSGVNSAISAIPVYGQIIGAATALSGIGRGMLKKDEHGRVKGSFQQGLDEVMKPQHEHIIEDATKGKWGDVALDVFLGGQHKTVSKWFS